MKIKTIAIIVGLLASSFAVAQNPPYRAEAAYVSPSAGVWNPWTAAAGFGSLSFDPYKISLYCQLADGQPWQPCNPGGGSGTTTNVLTGAASGGAAPGTTFNGAAARTFDYSTVGAVPLAGGDVAYQSVNSTPLGGAQGSLQVIANAVVDASQFHFSDGTVGWSAGPAYVSEGTFTEDFTYTVLMNPSKFTAPQILNNVTKLIAASDSHGVIAPAAAQAGGLGLQYSGFDVNHAYTSGPGASMVGLLCYAHFLKTGTTACYTSYVVALKTSQAYRPINGSSHLPTVVVGASEYIPGSLFLEQMRFSGDVANASVLLAAYDAAMLKMATAAGDATNVTFFTTNLGQVTASIQSEFIDGTSHMLFGATAQDAQIDVLSSGMAVWFSQYLNTPILTLAQQAAIGTFLHTNLATITHNGYFANVVTSGGVVTSWTTQGTIPSGGGGSGYTSACGSTTTYQNGYWSLVTGMAASALYLTNPTDVPTLLQTFRDASDPAQEYYTQAFGTSSGTCGTATTPNMESPQSAAWAAANLVGATPVAAGQGGTDKYGAVVTGPSGNYVNLCSAVTLSTGATCSGGIISITTGTTSFTVSAIPGTYINLEIGMNEYGTSGPANVLLQFNGDTGANYAYFQGNFSTTYASYSGNSLSSMPIAAVGDDGSAYKITVPFYSHAVFRNVTGVGSMSVGVGAAPAIFGGTWTNSAAITSITFLLSGGNFGTGFMTIYGTN